ncbi:MAG TPA: hypothetical protein VF380_00545, partial [Solirubrobacteraceae bacterium]
MDAPTSMDHTRVTQQTSTTLPLRGELSHDAPAPKALSTASFRGILQWALEGSGWSILRPTVDFVLLATATIVALGGITHTVEVPSVRAPLIAMPPLVMLLFY